MAGNRKRNNTLPLGSMAPWIVGLVFLCLTGVCYVGFKTQMHLAGNKMKLLERELSELDTQNEVLRAQISALSSRKQLQRHLDSGFISMIPITNDKIVRLATPGSREFASAVQPVSNLEVRR